MALPDKQKKTMSGDPADTDQVALLRNNPFLAPMFNSQDDAATPGAGADGSNNGVGQPKNAPGSSEQSAVPSVPSMFSGVGTDDSTKDLEDRVAANAPVASGQPSRGQRVKNFALNLFSRLGNAGYALSGGDPREMALKEQGEQFEEEQQRMKADPNYQRRVAEATTPNELEVSPDDEGGGYHYISVNKFTGQGNPTNIAAPAPEKTPAQLLHEFMLQNPEALIKGTPANQKYEELAESLRAFPSNQATIRANAEEYVGRMGVQRAIIQGQSLIRAMQGRNISEASKMKATALQTNLEAAAKGWAEFYTSHPYLQGLGYGPDPESQARFLADTMNQLSDIALESNQETQKIPGAAKVVPPQVPIIGPAANSAGGGVDSFVAKHSRK